MTDTIELYQLIISKCPQIIKEERQNYENATTDKEVGLSIEDAFNLAPCQSLDNLESEIQEYSPDAILSVLTLMFYGRGDEGLYVDQRERMNRSVRSDLRVQRILELIAHFPRYIARALKRHGTHGCQNELKTYSLPERARLNAWSLTSFRCSSEYAMLYRLPCLSFAMPMAFSCNKSDIQGLELSISDGAL